MPSASVTPPSEVGGSPRVPLARLALEAALALPDVVGADAGPHGLRVTVDAPAGLLRGVSVTAQADGRYAVDLCLTARMVPLVALSEEIRSRVEAAARRAGLADRLDAVSVDFAGVLTAADLLPPPSVAPPAGQPGQETVR